jgi:hypothetical protein
MNEPTERPGPDDLSSIDRHRRRLQELGEIRPDAPPLDDATRRAIRAVALAAQPLTDRQRERLLRLLKGSRYWAVELPGSRGSLRRQI